MSCTTMPNTVMDATSVKSRATGRASLTWAVVASICVASLGSVAPVQAGALGAAVAPLATQASAPVIEVQGPPPGWRGPPPGRGWGGPPQPPGWRGTPPGRGWGGPPPNRGWGGPPPGPPPRGAYGRPPPGAWYGPPPPRHARWGNPYWRNNGWYYRNNNNNAWIAAGVAGLALGAAAAAAAANNNNNAEDVGAVAYCARKFRSYNPRTGTYTGYDGLQHPCP